VVTERRARGQATPGGRWMLLIHQLPPKPDYFRVKIWRRLQRIGAVAIKNSVYVLPHTEQASEDFQWLRREIVAAGGEASKRCSAHSGTPNTRNWLALRRRSPARARVGAGANRQATSRGSSAGSQKSWPWITSAQGGAARRRRR
jgi:hypothetical protein